MRLFSTLRAAFVFSVALNLAGCSVESPEILLVKRITEPQADERAALAAIVDQVGASLAGHALLTKVTSRQLNQAQPASVFDVRALSSVTSRFEPSYRLTSEPEADVRTATASVDISASSMGLESEDHRVLIEVLGQFKRTDGVTEVLRFDATIKIISASGKSSFLIGMNSGNQQRTGAFVMELSICDLNNAARVVGGESPLEATDCGSGKIMARYESGNLAFTAESLDFPVGPYNLEIAKLNVTWDSSSDESGLNLEIEAVISREGTNVGSISGYHNSNGDSNLIARLNETL